MSSLALGKPTSPGWRGALPALLLLLGALLFLYRDSALAMVDIWERSETFAHAFVVPPISLWLIWRQRQALQMLTPRPNAWFLLPMAGAAVVWLLGDLVAANSLTQLALVTMLVLAVPTVLGVQATRLILFPLGFLYFAVPIGEFLMPQLMDWTADFTVLALRLTGIPVYREGLQFVIPSGHWSVVEACSGIRYLIASMMVGTLFSYLNYRSTRRRLLFVAVSIIVPLAANWLRAYLIVMVGHLSSNELATGTDHLVYGWLFFGVIMVLMFMIGARWAEPEAPPASAALAAVPAQGPPQPIFSVVAAAATLILLPQLVLWSLQKSESAAPPVLATLASPAPGWAAVQPRSIDWTPVFQNPSASLRQGFVKDGRAVDIYLAYYRKQDYQRKLVSSEKVLVTSGSKQWAQVAQGARKLALLGEADVTLNTAELRGSVLAGQLAEQRLVVWQLYWVNGRLTRNVFAAKAFGAVYRLLGRGDDGASLVFYTEKDASGGAEEALASFVRENLALIEAQLRKTRGQD